MNAFKRIGWKIDYVEDEGVDVEQEDERWSVAFELGLIVKGGQTLRIGNKKITADGTLDPSFQVIFWTPEGEVEEDVETEEYWSGRHDDYEPSHREHLVRWMCPPEDIEAFHIDGAGKFRAKKLEGREWDIRKTDKFAEAWTMQIFKNHSRSKLKKRGSAEYLKKLQDMFKMALKKKEMETIVQVRELAATLGLTEGLMKSLPPKEAGLLLPLSDKGVKNPKLH